MSLIVKPMLKVASATNSTTLLTRISQANSFVGVEFPDSYIVSMTNDALLEDSDTIGFELWGLKLFFNEIQLISSKRFRCLNFD